MKNILLTFGLLISISSIARGSEVYLNGITLTDPKQIQAFLTATKVSKSRFTVRLVLDPGFDLSIAKSEVMTLRKSAQVMIQVIDSSAISSLSDLEFQTHLEKILGLIEADDIIEIGNEVNGDWIQSKGKVRLKKIIDKFRGLKNKKALTLFYQGLSIEKANCNSKKQLDPVEWSLSQKFNKQDFKYIFLSWYPETCSSLSPDWKLVFQRLNEIYPYAKLGFGEIGLEKPEKQSTLQDKMIAKFYNFSRMSTLIRNSNYIGGNFWWYTGEQLQKSKDPNWPISQIEKILEGKPK